LGKEGKSFSLAFWFKFSSADEITATESAQIVGTASQYAQGWSSQGFTVYAHAKADDSNVVMVATSQQGGPEFEGENVRRKKQVNSVPFQRGQWIHAVVTYQNDGEEGSVFGISINTNERTGPAEPDVWNTKLRVGDQGWGTSAPIEIAEATIYQRILSKTEVISLFLAKATVTGFSLDELDAAINQFSGIISGTSSLTESEIDQLVEEFQSHVPLIGLNAASMGAMLDLIDAYELNTGGGLFKNTATANGLSREMGPDDTKAIDRAMFAVYQASLDEIYADHVQSGCAGEPLLENRAWSTASYFPGDVAPSSVDSTLAHKVTVDGTVPATFGRIPAFFTEPEVRTTGLYLQPGGTGTITVPDSVVAQGLRVRVGAHLSDHVRRSLLSCLP
jgi:hypothetical protein